MKIAVDVISGDNPPEELISGVCHYISKYKDSVIIIGDEERIKKKLLLHPYERRYIDIVHTTEIITMNESPAEAYRKKKNASVILAAQLVASKEATGFFSPGNTGAALAAALFEIGKIKNVSRPAIAAVLPNIKSSTILIDAGANTECKPHFLVEFALMADVFCKKVLKLENPRVGILSNGEEDEKGSDFTKKVFELMKDIPMHFIGNVEGYDLFNGSVDIVVTDGFTGNIALKTAEGVSKTVFTLLKNEIQKSIFSKIGALFLKDNFKNLKKKLDANEYGGAPLLGIDGNVIIGHGSANAKATFNALRTLRFMDQFNLNKEIESAFSKLPETSDS
ncbi:MAG: phosphate acyltransferase PlsX [Spirochaetes bacterium]|nr:phosphate acyltransferase PlsX [Spirochaetota bacterium]MBP8991822.1 phosphate acyltransferase PlsX [Spirochaetota bacterium]NLJ04435.1 phosphate acyltransferase PlsX [Exilispira sp.]HOV46747.1 phosphate acyltransferase PlsX [Exilispira sp.]